MSESLEQISFRLTSDELGEQERTLSSLRTCAGTILAAASVANSFLAVGTRHGSLEVWGVVAMAAFVLCAASAIWVLLPHPFVFAFRGAALLRTREGDLSVDANEAYRAAEAWMEPQVDVNRKKITRLEECMTLGCVLLAIEVISWSVAVIG